ncbi:MAG: class II fructose-bisphosphate aldolase [Spirochaetaceae bacterium]|nr:MAG: class II fructose-bisphosphate aldolase [Spirochaetaceae bacterium]
MLLSPLQARKLVSHCLQEKYALLAVNADSPAAIYDCLAAAKELDAAIVIQTSLWQLEGISFGADDALRGLAVYYAHINLLANSKEFHQVPVVLHTDHIRGPRTREILTEAIKGYAFQVDDMLVRLSPTTVSLDASKLTAEQNIEMLCSLIEAAESVGRPLTLEMEAGLDVGLTTPEEIESLIMGVECRHSGYVALFAPGLGNRHGFSKEGYPGFRPENISSTASLLERLTGRKIGIVLHGSSGLSEEQIREAVAHGLTKLNWSTDGLILRSSAAQEYYRSRQDQLVPGHAEFKVSAMDNGVGRFVSRRFVPKIKDLIELLEGAGRAGSFMAAL